MLLVVPSSGPRSVADLVAQAKAKPGGFSFGSSGAGTATHLFAELFARETGTALAHIPYKGSSQAVVALLAARSGAGSAMAKNATACPGGVAARRSSGQSG